jgi:hypothetical protein
MTSIARVMPGPGEPLVGVERPEPEPGPLEAIVLVAASSLNYTGLGPGDRVIGAFHPGWADGPPTPEAIP